MANGYYGELQDPPLETTEFGEKVKADVGDIVEGVKQIPGLAGELWRLSGKDATEEERASFLKGLYMETPKEIIKDPFRLLSGEEWEEHPGHQMMRTLDVIPAIGAAKAGLKFTKGFRAARKAGKAAKKIKHVFKVPKKGTFRIPEGVGKAVERATTRVDLSRAQVFDEIGRIEKATKKMFASQDMSPAVKKIVNETDILIDTQPYTPAGGSFSIGQGMNLDSFPDIVAYIHDRFPDTWKKYLKLSDEYPTTQYFAAKDFAFMRSRPEGLTPYPHELIGHNLMRKHVKLGDLVDELYDRHRDLADKHSVQWWGYPGAKEELLSDLVDSYGHNRLHRPLIEDMLVDKRSREILDQISDTVHGKGSKHSITHGLAQVKAKPESARIVGYGDQVAEIYKRIGEEGIHRPPRKGEPFSAIRKGANVTSDVKKDAKVALRNRGLRSDDLSSLRYEGVQEFDEGTMHLYTFYKEGHPLDGSTIAGDVYDKTGKKIPLPSGEEHPLQRRLMEKLAELDDEKRAHELDVARREERLRNLRAEGIKMEKGKLRIPPAEEAPVSELKKAIMYKGAKEKPKIFAAKGDELNHVDIFNRLPADIQSGEIIEGWTLPDGRFMDRKQAIKYMESKGAK